MQTIGRRSLLCAATAALGGFSTRLAEAQGGRPLLGVVIDASRSEQVDEAFQRNRDFGLPTCQVHSGAVSSLSLARLIISERETQGARQAADIRASKVYLEQLIAETYGVAA